MQFSGYCPFGVGKFSNAATPVKTAHQAIKAGYGSVLYNLEDLTTYEGAKAFAFAVILGVTRRHIERAANQRHPLSVWDKLVAAEKDWGLVPPATADLNARQLALAAQMLLDGGATQAAITVALQAIVGALNFYALATVKPGAAVNTPATATTQGSFQAPGVTPKYLKLLAPVCFLAQVTIPYAMFGPGSLVAGDVGGTPNAPIVGDIFTLDPGDENRAEAVTILAVTAGATPTVTFTATRPHNNGTVGATCLPMWRSTQRHVGVVVTAAKARDSETRRQIHAVMAKHMKSVTDWSILEASSATQTAPWIVNVAKVGSTALGLSAYTF